MKYPFRLYGGLLRHDQRGDTKRLGSFGSAPRVITDGRQSDLQSLLGRRGLRLGWRRRWSGLSL